MMKFKIAISILSIFFCTSYAFSQAKRALNHVGKEKFEQAEELLYKAILKDSINAGENYALSILYFSDKYIGFNVDSTYKYILKSLVDYKYLEPKEIEKLERDDIDSILMVNQKALIENYAFALAKQDDRQTDYESYILKYPTSPKFDSALWYRNQRAYESAQKFNTWEEYLKYIEEYPLSERYAEAKTNYEKLIFEEKTADGKLASYTSFLSSFPSTPFRPAIERSIFNISTGDHSIGSYEQFIGEYPQSDVAALASKRIYFKNPTIAFSGIAANYLNKDSLQSLAAKEKEPLFVTFQDPYYVFNAASGYKIEQEVTEVPQAYLCRMITGKMLLTTINSMTSILNKNGTIIYTRPEIDQINQLGDGIVAYEINGKYGLIFQNGDEISDPVYDEVKVIQHRYIAYKLNNKWGLLSVNGIQMTGSKFDELENAGVLIKITLKDKFALMSPDYLIPYLDGEENAFNYKYSDLEILDHDLIMIYDGDKEGLITNELRPVVPTGKQVITVLDNGIILETDKGYKILNREPEINSSTIWNSVDYNDQWLAVKGKDGWKIISQSSDLVIENRADSMKILNSTTLLIHKNDTSIFHFSNNKKVILPEGSSYTILSSPPIQNSKTANYYMITDGKSKTLVNSSADTVTLPKKYNTIAAIGKEYLVYTYRGKKGLLDTEGNTLLKPNFDGIANYNDGSLTVLNNGVLGLYNLSKGVNIPPEYDRSLRYYNDSLIIAHKDGKIGLITGDNKEFLPVKYSNISYFNDSVAWVMDSSRWHLMNIYSGDVILQNVTSFEPSPDSGIDYTKFTTTKGKGILNSNNGMIINGTFTEIRNIGTLENPVFYAELFVNEALLYVVIIYNARGKILFRSAYTEEEYVKVICDE